MSKVDVLHINPIEFSNNHLIRHVNHHAESLNREASRYPDLDSSFVGPASLPTSNDPRDCPSASLNTVELFDDLPPLHTGSVATHLKIGIDHAALASAANEPDAERAFFVADLSKVYTQFLRWKKCLPGIVPYYAVKCNPDPYVLRLLAALGAGFDCASHGEISQVLSLGTVSPSRILFANPCKATSFIRHACKYGVDAMTFDNADEILKISRIFPEARLVLRILTDDSKSVCRLGMKFGAPLQSVPSLLSLAKDLNLNVVGVSFHVGSGCYDPSAFTEAITLAKKAYDMGRNAGYKFTLLDVGGGFEDDGFESTAAVLRAAILDSFHEPLKEGDLQVIAEPGRFFVSRAFTLAANVIARRAGSLEAGNDAPTPRPDELGNHPQVMYYINDGVYGAFNCILFDHQTVVPYVLTLNRKPVEPKQGGEDSTIETPLRGTQSCSVWGPTCDSIDLVCPKVYLPRTLEVGDWLGFANMGAYTICAASHFNGFATSGVVYTAGVGGNNKRVVELLRISVEDSVCTG